MEHARYRVKNSEGHSDRWFNMSLGLKEGCPAAPIEFSIYHSVIMKDLKSRLLENPDESVRVGFGSEEFNDLLLIRENPSCKKSLDGQEQWRGTSKSVDLLLFADDTTSLCRRSNMQHRKELLKQTFGRLEAHLERRQMGAHHCRKRSGGNGNDSGRKWTEQHECLELIGTPWVRFITSRKHRLMAARKAWFKLSKKLPTWALSRKLEGQIAAAVVGADSSFLDAKYVASATKKKKNTKRCGLVWYLVSRDRSGEIWNETGKH